jgi:long-chain acyl-CoA synthetase
MHPRAHAQTAPHKPAFIMAYSGETVTYGELEARSNQGAHLFRALGLKAGDGVAIFLENHPRYFEVVWAAERAGLTFTCISSKLTGGEVEYIVRDCGAKAFIASPALAEAALAAAAAVPAAVPFMVGEATAPFRSFEAERGRFPTTPIADEGAGQPLLYSSGTTGRPKGVRRAPPPAAADGAPSPLGTMAQLRFGWTPPDIVYLSPAPLYHAAPLAWTMGVHVQGGTVVVMERFDAEDALRFIERHRINNGQFVPTHFVRMLKLPDEVKARYDLSSLRSVVHAAAPCPVPVKEQMIAWWGPIIHEYYAGTEGNGTTTITAEEWLAHKGSVGRATLGAVRICDEAGEPLPPRQEGLVFFEGGGRFEYHGDAAKTAESRNQRGWSTLGDVGWLDEEGYLYLTDRKSFMIISGGVNIYPQELENLLITHPKVTDVAVVGAPDPDMGEKVVAVVQPAPGAAHDDELRAELMAFARANLSHVKAPRVIDFMSELPRHATGKLYKRLIRDAYWGKEGSRIV